MMNEDWKIHLRGEFGQPYLQNLGKFIKSEYTTKTVYPAYENIFAALNITPYDNLKVVILGQDPYHGPGQAHGLSFSVPAGIPFPPSLQNIFKELADDLGHPIPNSGDLTPWAGQGVLLLNTTLTVLQGQPTSHQGYGWEQFTDRLLEVVNAKDTPVVFILWGSHARSKKKLIDTRKHLIIESPHPSPLSSYRGFFGSKPFSRANEFLTHKGVKPINWQL